MVIGLKQLKQIPHARRGRSEVLFGIIRAKAVVASAAEVILHDVLGEDHISEQNLPVGLRARHAAANANKQDELQPGEAGSQLDGGDSRAGLSALRQAEEHDLILADASDGIYVVICWLLSQKGAGGIVAVKHAGHRVEFPPQGTYNSEMEIVSVGLPCRSHRQA